MPTYSDEGRAAGTRQQLGPALGLSCLPVELKAALRQGKPYLPGAHDLDGPAAWKVGALLDGSNIDELNESLRKAACWPRRQEYRTPGRLLKPGIYFLEKVSDSIHKKEAANTMLYKFTMDCLVNSVLFCDALKNDADFMDALGQAAWLVLPAEMAEQLMGRLRNKDIAMPGKDVISRSRVIVSTLVIPDRAIRCVRSLWSMCFAYAFGVPHSR